MGMFMQEHDVHVENLLGQLNVRFGPTPDKKSHFGGIREMVELQKEFKIFKAGRSFRTSAALLNVGASNAEARNRLLEYFGNLAKHESNVKGQNGDAAIVAALVANLAAPAPLPVYFTYHDMRAEKGNTRVLIDQGKPVPFFKQEYLVVSFPTKAQDVAGEPAPASKASKGAKPVKSGKAAKPAKSAKAAKPAKGAK